MYCRPGWILGHFTLSHNDRTLFLFRVCGRLRLPASDPQRAESNAVQQDISDGKWECPLILDELYRTEEPLFRPRVSQIRMESWSRGRVALVGDAAFCVSLTAGQGSALAMVSAYVLAGELANAGGRHDEAFANYKSFPASLYSKKATGRRTLCRRACAKDKMGPYVPQPGDKNVRSSGTCKAGIGRDIIDALRLPTTIGNILHPPAVRQQLFDIASRLRRPYLLSRSARLRSRLYLSVSPARPRSELRGLRCWRSPAPFRSGRIETSLISSV